MSWKFTDFKKLKPYFALVPEDLRERSVIAGGSVLDFEKASDVDIFILNCPHMVEIRRLEKRFAGLLDDDKGSDGKAINFRHAKFKKKINIICDESRTAIDLLSGFDISTSQWAYFPTGQLQFLASSTAPGEPIVVYYLSKTTLARIQKYCARFGTGWCNRIRGNPDMTEFNESLGAFDQQKRVYHQDITDDDIPF